MKKCWLVLAVLLATGGMAEDLVIQSFDRDGAVVLNSVPNATAYWVEWAPGPKGPWKTFTKDHLGPLNNIPDDGTGVLSVNVPTTFRVVAAVRVPAPFNEMAPGSFTMGSPPDELGRESIETQFRVSIRRGFTMQTTEVTNQQMADVLNWALRRELIRITETSVRNVEGDEQELLDLDAKTVSIGGTSYGDCQVSWNGFRFMADAEKEDYPCVWVTWFGAQAYCNYLSDMEGLERVVDFTDWSWRIDGNGYRLPTEAEWEYACRAGTITAFCTGDITHTGLSPLDANLDLVGWYSGNSENPANPIEGGKGTHPVAQKQANPWGLFDMHGNVWEWCGDWFGDYPSEGQRDPTGPESGSGRVGRGGSWNWDAWVCRSALRGYLEPQQTGHDTGFRPVRTVIP